MMNFLKNALLTPTSYYTDTQQMLKKIIVEEHGPEAVYAAWTCAQMAGSDFLENWNKQFEKAFDHALEIASANALQLTKEQLSEVFAFAKLRSNDTKAIMFANKIGISKTASMSSFYLALWSACTHDELGKEKKIDWFVNIESDLHDSYLWSSKSEQDSVFDALIKTHANVQDVQAWKAQTEKEVPRRSLDWLKSFMF